MPKVKLSYSPNYEAVSKNIRKLLIERDITRAEVAERSFIKYSTLCYKLKKYTAKIRYKGIILHSTYA